MSLPARVDRIGSVDIAELLTLEQEASDLDAIWVFSALRRRWIFVLLGPVVFALVGGLLAARQDKVYETAALVSLESSAAERAFGSNTTGTADREIQTEVQYLNSTAFRLLFGTTLARSADFRAQIVFNTSAVELVGRAATAGRAARPGILTDYYGRSAFHFLAKSKPTDRSHDPYIGFGSTNHFAPHIGS